MSASSSTLAVAALAEAVVKVAEYTPPHFESLRQAALQINPNLSLAHQPFVDYYYTGNSWCKLFLLLAADGSVAGTIGVDLMHFLSDSRELTVGFGSNFYSLRPGLGTYLFVHWLKFCPIGFVFGGSEDTHRILRRQNWTYFPGITTYVLNKPYQSFRGERYWRVMAKSVLQEIRRARIANYAPRIPREAAARISVQEEPNYTEDLLPRRSPFAVRFAPSFEYLKWRYRVGLSFVCYRAFRVLSSDKTIGYVIINESPEQLIVAQCDGEDAEALAYGVLFSVLQVARDDTKPRTVWLVSSHPRMQRVYEQFGFQAEKQGRPFVMGGFGGAVDLPVDTSNWLVSLDWGDNGLRVPFKDQPFRLEAS